MSDTSAAPSRASTPNWRLIALGASVALLTVLFWEALVNLWFRWGDREELSHSYFIPVISAWLVWTNREAVKASIGTPSILSLAILGGAGLLLILGQLTQIFVFQHIGLVVAIAGLIVGYGGLSLLRVTAAPVAFLVFAIPPPFWVITILSGQFQQMSSILGVAMLELVDIPVYLSGNIIDLGEYKLAVAEACSGLRYLFPFLSLGVMTAYLFKAPLWQRAIVVASTIPITILMNSIRIAFTGIMVQAYGPEQAEGALHLFEGWVVFLLCLVALFGVIAVFCYFAKPRRSPRDALGAPELSPVTPSKSSSIINVNFIYGGLALIPVAVLGLSQIVNVDALIIPERKDFDRVAIEFDNYRITERPIEPEIAEVLGADDSIVIDTISNENDYVNIYMAYLEAQRDGRSWHSPRQCMPGGGWEIAKHEIVKSKAGDGRKFNYNRLVIQNRDQRQLVYYWYDQRGRKVANEFSMKLWLILDAVTKHRSDGAMVRLITPIINEEGVGPAEERLQAMVTKMESFLPEYVPQ